VSHKHWYNYCSVFTPLRFVDCDSPGQPELTHSGQHNQPGAGQLNRDFLLLWIDRFEDTLVAIKHLAVVIIHLLEQAVALRAESYQSVISALLV